MRARTHVSIFSNRNIEHIYYKNSEDIGWSLKQDCALNYDLRKTNLQCHIYLFVYMDNEFEYMWNYESILESRQKY
jgi:hypothetical protein